MQGSANLPLPCRLDSASQHQPHDRQAPLAAPIITSQASNTAKETLLFCAPDLTPGQIQGLLASPKEARITVSSKGPVWSGAHPVARRQVYFQKKRDTVQSGHPKPHPPPSPRPPPPPCAVYMLLGADEGVSISLCDTLGLERYWAP